VRWYYGTLADEFAELQPGPLPDELSDAVRDLDRLVGRYEERGLSLRQGGLSLPHNETVSLSGGRRIYAPNGKRRSTWLART
jgi:hypothetical protein